MALQICTLLLKKEGLCEKHEDYYFTAAFVHVFFFYIIFPFFFLILFFPPHLLQSLSNEPGWLLAQMLHCKCYFLNQLRIWPDI